MNLLICNLCRTFFVCSILIIFLICKTGTASINTFIFENQSQLYQIKNGSSFMNFKLSEYTKQFINTHLNQINRNHYIVDAGHILEEYFDGIEQPISFHTVEVAVSKKKIVPWVLNDNIYWPHRPLCFLGVGLPSRLSAVVQNKVWALMDHLMNTLIKYGYDNQFLNAELIIFDDGKMKIMEINGRMSAQCIPIYSQVLLSLYNSYINYVTVTCIYIAYAICNFKFPNHEFIHVFKLSYSVYSNWVTCVTIRLRSIFWELSLFLYINSLTMIEMSISNLFFTCLCIDEILKDTTNAT